MSPHHAYDVNMVSGAVVKVFPDVSDVSLPDDVALVMPRQTHTCNVAVVDEGNMENDFPDTDALVTRLRRVAVGVRTADCVPILLHAPDIDAVAAIHAGWKGTLGGIVGSAVDCLKEMGADVANIHAVFGPSICGECYETDADLAHRFVEAGFGAAVMIGAGQDPLGERDFPESSHRIDLPYANHILLERSGVNPQHIEHSAVCTRHHGHPWPSWRRDPGTTCRLASLIYLP